MRHTLNFPVDFQLLLSNPLDDDGISRFVDECAEKASASSSGSIISLTVPAANYDPLAILEIFGRKNTFQYYWEKPDLDFAIAAGGRALTLLEDGEDRFEKLARKVDGWNDKIDEHSTIDHSLSGPVFLCGFSFFPENESPYWQAFGSANSVLPSWMYVKNGSLSLLTMNVHLNGEETTPEVREIFNGLIERFLNPLEWSEASGATMRAEPTEVISREEHPGFKDWTSGVSKAVKKIRQGEFQKIVLARSTSVKTRDKIIPTRLLNKLRQEYPTCYNFIFQPDEHTAFVGCSPERLSSFNATYLLTEGLAGSIVRGKTATEDTRLEHQLLKSRKDRSEHQIVVDAISESLRSLDLDIEYSKEPGVKKYANVQHLHTPIIARFNGSVNPLQVLEQLHPTPAVGGHPKKVSLNNISKLEKIDRGWYAGPIGWFNSRGQGEFSVAIRSGLIRGNKAMFYSGCGIVEDSDPAREWEETNIKLIPMLSAVEYA